MERDGAESLDAFAHAAHSQELKHLLRRHEVETGWHIVRIEQVFGTLGIAIEDHPCLPVEALDKEARAQIKRCDDALVDDVILAAAAAVEHYEIAAYDWLVAQADAIGIRAVAAELRESREQEQRALGEIRRRIAAKAQLPVRKILAGSATRRAKP
jgi:ferritin-like metal-binding protein YciE